MSFYSELWKFNDSFLIHQNYIMSILNPSPNLDDEKCEDVSILLRNLRVKFGEFLKFKQNYCSKLDICNENECFNIASIRLLEDFIIKIITDCECKFNNKMKKLVINNVESKLNNFMSF